MGEQAPCKIMLSGWLPGEEHQGVTLQVEALLADDGRDLVVVGVIEQASLTTGRGHNTGKVPTLQLRWRSIEVADNPGRAEKALALLGEIRADRVGQDELDGVGDAAVADAAEKKTRKRTSKAPRSNPLQAVAAT